MEQLEYISFRANASTPLTTLKKGELVVADEKKDYVEKGTVVTGAVNTIMINYNGQKRAVKVIQTEGGKYAPVKFFDRYVDEFSNISGKRNIIYKSKVYRENNMIKYAVPMAAVLVATLIAHKRGVTGKKLVLTGVAALFIGRLPYFYLKNKQQ